MSRLLDDLHPDLQAKCHQFLDACSREGIDILVTCTYRSNEEQRLLYAQGRTAPGKIVTNALPGKSAHNHVNPNGSPCSMAFDVVPMVHGKPDWNTHDPQDLALWNRVGEIGKSFGLEWAGDWKTFKEFPHFQLPGFVAI